MSKKWIRIGAVAVMFAAASLPAFAQDEDLRKEIEELKKGQQEILRQLKQIESRMAAPKPAAAPQVPDIKGKVFEIGNNPVVDSPQAKLTMIELTDYQ